MKDKDELSKLTINELHSELLSLREKQFKLRMQKANGTLDKTHTVRVIRRTIATVKTMMTKKAGISHVK